jgi:hypothetical protein
MIDHAITGTGASERKRMLSALVTADFGGERLHLDLSPLDRAGASKRRLSPTWWIPALSNLLTARYGNLDLRVTLPEEHGVRLQLLRGGLYFALAQRTGPTRMVKQDEATRRLLEASSGTWNSTDGENVLFPVADGYQADDRLFLYSNTHFKCEPGYFRKFQGSAAFPWLRSAIPRPVDREARSVWQGFLASVSEGFAEVLDNESVHAFNLRDIRFQAGWLGSTVVERSRSCLLVSTTKGGKNSHDRLYFLSLDNGFGLARTLRWQHPDELIHDSAADIVERIFTHKLSERNVPGHNGAGLWYLHDLLAQAGGTITVLTEDDQSDGQRAVRLQLSMPPPDEPRNGIECTRWSEQIPFRGTLIHTQLEVPRIEDASSRTLASRAESFYRFRRTSGGSDAVEVG